MTIRPELEEVKAIAAGGQYKVLPVSCELLSDLCTPIQALRILKNISTHCYLLESAQQNEKWGRYTFLGYDPKLEITCMDGELRAGNLRMHTDAPPPSCGRSWRITAAPGWTTCRPLPADWWGNSPTTIWDTANRRCGPGWRTARPSRMWT